MQEFTKYFLYFLIYSFFGYICEVVYVSLCTKKLTNRGFLYGPVVPIYGFGAIGIILALSWAVNIGQWWCPILVFVLGFLLTSALEYITSLVMELIFHMRWWDYSDKFCNINGRVCLRNSSMFGALVLIVLYVLHPLVVTKGVDILLNAGVVVFYIVSGILAAGMAVDTVLSTIKHVNIAKLLRKIEEMAAQAAQEIKEKGSEVSALAQEKAASFKNFITETKVAKRLAKVQLRYPSMKIASQLEKARLSFAEFMDKVKSKI